MASDDLAFESVASGVLVSVLAETAHGLFSRFDDLDLTRRIALLNSKAMNDPPVRNDLPLLVVSMWQGTAEDNQTVKGGSG
jgi:hypothetical protein